MKGKWKRIEVTNRIDIDLKRVAVPELQIFPDKKHAITRASLLCNISKHLAPIFKCRELVVAEFLECGTHKGYLLPNRIMANFMISYCPPIVNRIQDVNPIMDKIDTVNKIVMLMACRNENLQNPREMKMVVSVKLLPGCE